MDIDQDQPPRAAAEDEGAGDDIMDVDMPYIDRLVYEIENNGEDDDSSLDLVEEGGEDDSEEEGDSDSEDEEDDDGSEGGSNSGSEEENSEENESSEDEDQDDSDPDAADASSQYDDEPSSDEELMYDSDEDIAVKIKRSTDRPQATASRQGNLSNESKDVLLWRTDKDESYSDWSIEVTTPKRGRNTTKLYHVHRSVLAAGPKKSGYFDALFKSGQFQECTDRTSKVTFDGDIASHFPDFLDFMYCPPQECQRIVKYENVFALKCLAEYFIVPKLTEAIFDFIERDMRDLKHMEKYLLDCCGSEESDQTKLILGCATRACAERILSINADSPLLAMLPPAMFLQVFKTLRASKYDKRSSDDIQHICQLAVEYLKMHQSILDGAYFNALFKELYFPYKENLAGEVAIEMLELENLFGWELECYTFDTCVAALSRYLASVPELTVRRLTTITVRVPQRAVSAVLLTALNRNKVLKPRRLDPITCNIAGPGYFGIDEGSITLYDIKSTDSINCIRRHVADRLSVIPNRVQVFHGDKELFGHQIVSKCNITSSTELEIRFSWT